MLNELSFGLRLIRRHGLVILGVVVATTGFTALRDQMTPRTYEAVSRILILQTVRGSQALNGLIANFIAPRSLSEIEPDPGTPSAPVAGIPGGIDMGAGLWIC